MSVSGPVEPLREGSATLEPELELRAAVLLPVWTLVVCISGGSTCPGEQIPVKAVRVMWFRTVERISLAVCRDHLSVVLVAALSPALVKLWRYWADVRVSSNIRALFSAFDHNDN